MCHLCVERDDNVGVINLVIGASLVLRGRNPNGNCWRIKWTVRVCLWIKIDLKSVKSFLSEAHLTLILFKHINVLSFLPIFFIHHNFFLLFRIQCTSRWARVKTFATSKPWNRIPFKILCVLTRIHANCLHYFWSRIFWKNSVAIVWWTWLSIFHSFEVIFVIPKELIAHFQSRIKIKIIHPQMRFLNAKLLNRKIHDDVMRCKFVMFHDNQSGF